MSTSTLQFNAPAADSSASLSDYATAFVHSITGTANEIIASASVGAVGLSTPQAIGTTSKPTFGGLTVTSTSEGILVPRMTTTQRDAIASPVAGWVIYNTTTGAFNVYNGAWSVVGAQSITDFLRTDLHFLSLNDASSVTINASQFLFRVVKTGSLCTLLFQLDYTATDALNGGFIMNFDSPALQAALNPSHDVISVGVQPDGTVVNIEVSPDVTEGDLQLNLPAGTSFALTGQIFGQIQFTQ